MGSDIFTSKCEAHNYVVPYRSSCPVCVSAKRSQLHAANMAHMPRYLFEQQLDVRVDSTGMASGPCVLGVDAPKPVRSYMKAPEHNNAEACEVRWKVNFKSNYLSNSYAKLSSTTQALLMALDVTTDARLLKMRQDYQAQIDSGATSPKDQDRLGYNLAIDMYHEIVRVSKGRIEDPERVTGQFVGYFRLLYGNGQRLIVDEPAIKPVTVPKYKLTLRSRDWKSHYDIMEDTQEVFRILEFGIPEVYQRWFSLCESVHKGTITVESMAYTMWDTVVQQHELRELKRNMLVRNDFVARFKYLYVIGTQRIVIDETAQLPAVDDDLAGCLYNYSGTSSKTLYHEQALLEDSLDQEKPVLTRDGIIGRFRRLTALITDAYAKDRMYDWEKINAKTQRALQERLADAYLEGKRR